MNKQKLFFLTLTSFCLPVLADDSPLQNLDEITVTAEKRESTANQVPVALEVFSGQQLLDANVDDTETLINEVTNMHMIDAGNHSTAGFFSIRGVTPVMEGAQSVGFFVDDVLHNTFDAQLFDIERIEILKGPQGTLYGRNTLAGVVNVITKEPTENWENEAHFSYGSDQNYMLGGVLSGPLIADKALLRIALQKEASDGGFENIFDGNDKVDERDDINLRTKLKLIANNHWTVDLIGDYQRARDGNGSFRIKDQSHSDPHKVNMDYGGFSDLDAQGYKLKVTYQGPEYIFTSISAQTDERLSDSIDLDFSPADFMRLDTDVDTQVTSQELRLVSNHSSQWDWLIGAYLFKEEADVDFFIDMRQGFPAYGLPPYKDFSESTTVSKGQALFGQVGYQVNDRLKLSAGLRYDRESKDFDIYQYSHPSIGPASGLSDSDSFDAWLPKFTLQYQINPKVSTYASIARGYKSGGFNRLASLNNPNIETAFAPEFTWNYELGVKSSFLQDRLEVSAAIFHIDWTDQQIEQQLYPQSVITNAGESTSQGAELSIVAKPSNRLRLKAGLGYTHARFDHYQDDEYDTATGNIIGRVDYQDNRIPFVPELSYHLSAEYRISDSWLTRISLNGNGDYYHDVQNSIKEESREIVNAQLGYENQNIGVYLWVKNLFDQEYDVRAFNFPGVGTISRAGDGRSIGLRLRADF